MNVKEARLKKSDIELKISDLLSELSMDTGVYVNKIEVRKVPRIDGETYRYIVDIEASI